MADFRGADLDRHITGAYGARSNMGGEEPAEDEICESCNEPFDVVERDNDYPEMCRDCTEMAGLHEEDE